MDILDGSLASSSSAKYNFDFFPSLLYDGTGSVIFQIRSIKLKDEINQSCRIFDIEVGLAKDLL